MSYSISYNPELSRQYPPIRKCTKKTDIKIVTYTLLAVIVGYILLKCGVAHYLLPGDMKITTAAFSSLVEQVGAGEPIGEAVVAFIQDVVANGA